MVKSVIPSAARLTNLGVQNMFTQICAKIESGKFLSKSEYLALSKMLSSLRSLMLANPSHCAVMEKIEQKYSQLMKKAKSASRSLRLGLKVELIICNALVKNVDGYSLKFGS